MVNGGRIPGVRLAAVLVRRQTLFEFCYPGDLGVDEMQAVIEHGVDDIRRALAYLPPAGGGLMAPVSEALVVVVERLQRLIPGNGG